MKRKTRTHYCVSVKDARIYKKTTNVLGSELSYGLFDVDLSDDLYVYDTISCPNFECPEPENPDSNTDCSCDYTQCPPKSRPSTCTNQCPTDKDHPCTGEWEVLQLDKVYNFSINKTKQFRFKANGLECNGISLKANSISGYGNTDIGSSLNLNDLRTMGRSFQRNIQYNICPSDNIQTASTTFKKSWTRDTYFIQVTPLSNVYNFSLVLHSLKIQNVDSSVTPCQLSGPLSTTHKCLDIGTSYEISVGYNERKYFAINITKPDYYYFNFPIIDQTLNILISDNDNVTKPVLGEATWELMEDTENFMLLYLEPKSDGTPLTIYITAVAYYPTTYVFSITNYGKKYQQSIYSSESAQVGYLNLRSTSKLYLSSGSYYTTHTLSTSDLKKTFDILYPQEDLNPLWPVSSIFDYVLSSSNLNPTFNTFKPNSYQASFLLEQNGGYIYTKYLDYDSLKNSTLVINSNIFDKDGKPVKLSTKFREIQLECDIEKFNKANDMIKEIEGSLFDILDRDNINNYRYNLDSLTITDAWYGCQSQILNYFETETYLGYRSLKNCPYEATNPLFQTNPCCNSKLSYYECCNPSDLPFNTTKNTLLRVDSVKNQCSSPDCSLSVLTDFNRSLSTIEECTISGSTISNIEYEVVTVLRECKNELISPVCTLDSDCDGYGAHRCDLFKRQCIPDFDTIDKSFLKCVLENLPRGVLYYLLDSTTAFNSKTIDTLHSYHATQDCIGYQSIMDRSTYTFSSAKYGNCNKNEGCLDSTCLIHHDICYDNIALDSSLKLISHIGNCDSFGFCPHLDCTNLNNSLCKSQCNPLSFCGYCTDDTTNCHVFPNPDQQSCENEYVCLLSDGSYKEGVDKATCESQYGKCSSACGTTCTTPDGGSSGCFILKKNNQTECESSSGVWLSNSCTAPNLDQSACNAAGSGYSWVECASKVYGECSGPLDSVFACKTQYSKDCTKEQCSTVGECTDSYYFSPDSNSNYPKGLGKCLKKHLHYYSTMTCEFNAESDSPNGCFTLVPSYLTKAACENFGGTWWVPAKNKDECTSQTGCRVIDRSDWGNLPYNYKFNEMTKDNCSACRDTLNEWTNKFEWTPSTWLPGVYVKKQWLENKSFVPNKLESKVFNYENFYDSVMNALNTHVSELYRSQAFCRMERIQSNLNSLACSCFGEGGPQCFESSVPLLGQAKVCAEESSKFTFDFGLLNFTKDSISESCQTLSISQMSREIYTSTVPDSLASNFVSYNKPDNFAIYNEKGATIGTMISDGVMIKSQDGVRNVDVCFKISDSMNFNEKYPTVDLAIQENEKDKPTPLSLSIHLNKEGDVIYYCGFIEDVPKGSPIYFQINRADEWEGKSKELFDEETKGLMYALAVIFLVVAVAGFYELGTLLYLYTKKIVTQFQLIHLLLVFVTGFILIRSIYFFLLVNGKLSDSPVADYILVVLPTFIYFTSFCLIIILWYVIVFLVLKKNRGADTLTKRLYSMVFIINLVLYMLFIAIVLVFQYTKYTPINDCGSRIFVATKTSAAQRGVSIAYAVIQAFISLLLGTAFIYLGSSLYKRLHFGNVNTGSKTNHQTKVFILSIICSIGFLLHCAFVLVLVSDFNSIVFSFIGLIITEIIPAIAILYCFNPREKQRDKNGNTLGNSTTTGRSTKLSKFGGNESPHESQASSSNEN
ncbi:hypothetical protein DICPUDRAFT_78846 [Dictyostelium purpureum]|uniref:THH1/TOM1/TOM3 domain-containing protein n=1 Tax=Dictyostelium purpureum TaxID=5786 RepID=F0ZKR5_DICPU|nr:uncharacterized protein DICPUDRAFT_78846 [Dictyostelium purpureum]EGC35455.1 hypothetical protein DICPUDRAFT_78846 [Dictyostelium purpureum]|eukprot:XP_003287998.1 hypothetical protein DICPUDRAFT_78846 [Dictyostelium purpureum]